jgi:hypothetical protein
MNYLLHDIFSQSDETAVEMFDGSFGLPDQFADLNVAL